MTKLYGHLARQFLIINSIHLLNTELKSSPEEVPEVLTTSYAPVLTPWKGLQSQYEVAVSRPFLLNPKGQTKTSGTVLFPLKYMKIPILEYSSHFLARVST